MTTTIKCGILICVCYISCFKNGGISYGKSQCWQCPACRSGAVGSKVKVRSNLGRHKYDVTEGVITETYPCIFLVQVKNAEENSYQTVSYSYTDVITKDVQLTLC